MKKLFIVIAPENGWDNIVSIYLAKSEKEVWEDLAAQNIDDTIESIKKDGYYKILKHHLIKEL